MVAGGATDATAGVSLRRWSVQRWEYCVVVSGPGNAAAVFHAPEGRNTVPIESDATEGAADTSEAWSRFIAQLGRDGWELVSTESPSAHALALFFKRPVSSEGAP